MALQQAYCLSAVLHSVMGAGVLLHEGVRIPTLVLRRPVRQLARESRARLIQEHAEALPVLVCVKAVLPA